LTNDPNEKATLANFLPDEGNIEENVINMSLKERTIKILATLTPREEKILRMRFGIGEKSDYTLEEVGVDFDVTRERIRQIEAQGLRKLRHPKRAGILSAHSTAYRPLDKCLQLNRDSKL